MNEEILTSCRVRLMRDGELIRDFSCNDLDLDDYILNEADLYQSEFLSTNYLLEDSKANLMAFFTLLNDRVCVADFRSKTEFNRFRKRRFVQAKRFKGYPAVKIGRLAVSTKWMRNGLGSILLDFIKSYFTKNRRTGCRFLTVDAYHGAVDFYAKNGFVRLSEGSPDGNTCLMYYDLIDYKSKL